MNPTRSNQQEASASCSWNGSLPPDGKIRQYPRKFKTSPDMKAAIVLDKVPGLELVEYINAVNAAVSPARVEWADELEPAQVCLFLSDVTAAQNCHGVFVNVAGHRLRARALTDPPLVRVLVTNASPLTDNETIEWHLDRQHNIKVKNWVHLEAKPSRNPQAQPKENVLSFVRYFYIEAHYIPKLPAKIEGRAHDKSYTIYFGSEDHWCDFCHRVGHYEWSCSKQLMARSIGLNQRPTIPVVNGTAPSSTLSTPGKNVGVYYDDTNRAPTTPNGMDRSAPRSTRSTPRKNLGVNFDDTAAESNGTNRSGPPCTPPKQSVAPGEDVSGAFGLRFVLAHEKSPRQVKHVQPSAPPSLVGDHADGAAAAEAAAAAAVAIEAATTAEAAAAKASSAAAAAAAAVEAAAKAEAAAAKASSAATAAAASAASASSRADSAEESAEVALEASVEACTAANLPLSPRKDSTASTGSDPSCSSSLKKKIRNQMNKNNKNNKKNKKTSVAPSSSLPHLYTKASEKKTAAAQAGPSGTSTSQITPAPSRATGASLAAGPSKPRTDTSNDSSTNPPIVGAIEIHPPPATEGSRTIEESAARLELPVQLHQPGETDEGQANSPRSSQPSPSRPDGSILRLAPATPNSPSNGKGSPAPKPNNSKSPSGSSKGKRSLKSAFQRLL